LVFLTVLSKCFVHITQAGFTYCSCLFCVSVYDDLQGWLLLFIPQKMM